MKITLTHGSGGRETADIISNIFARHFNNDVINLMEDAAVLPGSEKIAFTTDSFVLTPLIFENFDIGTLAVCGTVNDLLMRGARPKYITSAFIIEEGADSATLDAIAKSMAKAAKEAGVQVVCGDTKVIEGSGGIYINTAGIGFVENGVDIQSRNITPGDSIIVSGVMGSHHAAVMSKRMDVKNNIRSDCAPLVDIVSNLSGSGIQVHAMRDVTRGGLATVLAELAGASGTKIEIFEEKIPVDPEVSAFANILGLDIMHMGNEGKLVAAVPQADEEKALQIIRASRYGEKAEIIGRVQEGSGVNLITPIGGVRQLRAMSGGGLPRIC
ncbi:MAG: hydrogenase expression/formation protein HypE [Clostridiales bacterium]|nr:hydrogenase expression/formation protein HypE [Clostridiales bacterium]